MTFRAILRAIGRALVAAALLGSISMIGIQYARMAHRNLVLAHALAATQSDIGRLQASRTQRLSTIKRLENPRGAIPEIHDRLHLTLPNEAIIYLKQPPAAHR
ncbi:MAG: hypothetical protein ACRENA_12515 [Vulcanimicrobiaceae bacterium]